jgi:hypothetical protein
VWVKRDRVDVTEMLLSQGPGTGAYTSVKMGFSRTASTGLNHFVVSFGGSDDAFTASSHDDDTGMWVHWGVTFEGSGSRERSVYRDGGKLLDVVNAAAARAYVLTSGDVFVGQQWDGAVAPYEGALDELRVWHRALSRSEAMDNHASLFRPLSTLGEQARGLVAFFTFDAPTAIGVDGSVEKINGAADVASVRWEPSSTPALCKQSYTMAAHHAWSASILQTMLANSTTAVPWPF